MNTIIKVKEITRLFYVVVLMSWHTLAQEFTTCESGEVGVFVSMQYTDINIPAGEVSWDIQDVDMWYNRDCKENRFRMSYSFGCALKDNSLVATIVG